MSMLFIFFIFTLLLSEYGAPERTFQICLSTINKNQRYDITDSQLFYMKNLPKIVPWETQIKESSL